MNDEKAEAITLAARRATELAFAWENFWESIRLLGAANRAKT